MVADANILDLALCREVAATCAAIKLRKTAMLVGRRFDQKRRVTGLTGTQFSLLVALALAGSPAMSRLAGMLSLDQTTLSRNLKPLRKKGLVEVTPGRDRRVRNVSLALEGRHKLNEALLLWGEAQAEFVERLGPERWETLAKHLSMAQNAVETP